MDFVRAANRSLEGRSIIALQSTNRDRSRSRIVARLAACWKGTMNRKTSPV